MPGQERLVRSPPPDGRRGRQLAEADHRVAEPDQPLKAERARLARKATARRAEQKASAAATSGGAAKKATSDGPESGKTSAVMGFNDHLSADCGGHQIDVFGRATLLGGVVTLVINGEEASQRDVYPGQEIVLKGKAAEAEISVRVSQGMFGTDYALNVGGKRCKLVKL